MDERIPTERLEDMVGNPSFPDEQRAMSRELLTLRAAHTEVCRLRRVVEGAEAERDELRAILQEQGIIYSGANTQKSKRFYLQLIEYAEQAEAAAARLREALERRTRLARLFGAALLGIAEHSECDGVHHAEPCPRCDAASAIDPEAIEAAMDDWQEEGDTWEDAFVAPGYFRMLDGDESMGAAERKSVLAGAKAIHAALEGAPDAQE